MFIPFVKLFRLSRKKDWLSAKAKRYYFFLILALPSTEEHIHPYYYISINVSNFTDLFYFSNDLFIFQCDC